MADLDNQNDLLDEDLDLEQEVETSSQAPAETNNAATRVKKIKRKMTWQEKLDEGHQLTDLEDVKSEADYGVRRHLREQKERAAFEARKSRSLNRSTGNNGGEY